MSKPPSQTPPSRPRKGRVFLISLLLSLAAGLLLGCGLYMARRYMTKGSAADSFMLADQGYTGNSFQKQLSVIQQDPAITETSTQVQSSVVTIIVNVVEDGVAGQGLGSGIVFQEDATQFLILTNAHVVAGATEIYLYLPEANDVISLRLVGSDETSDIAVLSLSKGVLSSDMLQRFTVAQLGDSDQLRTGQTVIAVGSPQDIAYQNSVTVGVISYPKRELTLSNGVTNPYIQTDVAVNPGNSGGALFDETGAVICIISNKIALTDVEGIAFAIPINHAQEVIDSLLSEGFVEHLSLGGIEDSIFLSSSMASLYHVPSGLVISSIRSGSSAEQAGLQNGDIITAIDDVQLTSMEDVNSILLSHQEGDTVTVTVIRGRNTDQPITATLTLEPVDTETQSGGFWEGSADS